MKKSTTCQSFLFILVLHATCLVSFSQNVGIGTDTPHPNAVLDINGINKGLLIPRGDAAFRSALNSNTAKGLLMFDTITNLIWMHNGNALASGWQEISNT